MMARYKQGDFFSWDDDLDLDMLLGDYTCDELENSSDGKDTVCVYQCPQCNKEYRSISGFRGHVLKKHNMNLKGLYFLVYIWLLGCHSNINNNKDLVFHLYQFIFLYYLLQREDISYN